MRALAWKKGILAGHQQHLWYSIPCTTRIQLFLTWNSLHPGRDFPRSGYDVLRWYLAAARHQLAESFYPQSFHGWWINWSWRRSWSIHLLSLWRWCQSLPFYLGCDIVSGALPLTLQGLFTSVFSTVIALCLLVIVRVFTNVKYTNADCNFSESGNSCRVGSWTLWTHLEMDRA